MDAIRGHIEATDLAIEKADRVCQHAKRRHDAQATAEVAQRNLDHLAAVHAAREDLYQAALAGDFALAETAIKLGAIKKATAALQIITGSDELAVALNELQVAVTHISNHALAAGGYHFKQLPVWPVPTIAQKIPQADYVASLAARKAR